MVGERENGPTRAASGLVGSETRRPGDAPARLEAAKHMPPIARAGRRNVQSTNASLFLAAAVGAAAGSLAKQSLRSGGGQSCHVSWCGGGEWRSRSTRVRFGGPAADTTEACSSCPALEGRAVRQGPADTVRQDGVVQVAVQRPASATIKRA